MGAPGKKTSFRVGTSILGRGRSLESGRLASCPSPTGSPQQDTASHLCIYTGQINNGHKEKARRGSTGLLELGLEHLKALSLPLQTEPLSLAEVAFLCQMSTSGYFT